MEDGHREEMAEISVPVQFLELQKNLNFTRMSSFQDKSWTMQIHHVD